MMTEVRDANEDAKDESRKRRILPSELKGSAFPFISRRPALISFTL